MSCFCVEVRNKGKRVAFGFGLGRGKEEQGRKLGFELGLGFSLD